MLFGLTNATNETSNTLPVFTVGPLGFCECERMLFGLTNAPATFQRIMDSCLGNSKYHGFLCR